MVAAAWIATWGLLAPAGAAPATAPAERSWGKSQAGLAVSVAAEGDWRLDGSMTLSVAVRNRGAMAVALPAAEEVFGYLMIRQRDTTWYTEKIHHARGVADWRGQLASGEVLALPPADVAALKAFASRRGLLLTGGYPTEMRDGKPVARTPAGTVAEVLKLGPARVQHLVYLARKGRGERALLLKSNVAKPTVAVAEFAALPAGARAAILADIAARIRKDAFSAQAAHGDAVGVGAPAVTMLAGVVKDARAGGFARMWAATALADIGGDRAAEVLIGCLDDPAGGVRHVAAYHGMKLRNPRFDQAANAKAATCEQPDLTAWVLLGYCQFRGGKAPAALVAAAVDSDQQRVRLAVARTFTRTQPVPAQLPHLHKLARDPVEQVRHSAAVALGMSRSRSRETVQALMDCLAKPGDHARRAAADALCKITGRTWSYARGISDEEKKDVVAKWQQWWRGAKGSYK